MRKMYETRYVAFADILGFSALVRRIPREPGIYDNIVEALRQMRTPTLPVPTSEDIQFRAQQFSDGIALSTTVSAGGLWYLLFSIDALCFSLLQSGIFVRGGVSKGQLHHDNEIVFGQGFLDAYHLESQVARYPRIILSRHVYADARRYADELEVCQVYSDSRIIRSDDGPAFLHVLLDLEMFNRTPKSQSTAGAEGHYLVKVGQQIRTELEKRLDETMDEPSYFEKTRWFADYWNRRVAKCDCGDDVWFKPIAIPGGIDDNTINRLPFYGAF